MCWTPVVPAAADVDAIDRREPLSTGIHERFDRQKLLGEQIGDRFSEERMISRLTMLFGGLALLLGQLGCTA